MSSFYDGSSAGPRGRPSMAHALEDVTQGPIAPRRMGLVDHAVLAAAVAGDPQEPRRERPQRLGQGFGSGRQRVGAVATPVASGRHDQSLPVARRTISRHSASAASPRRRCSSGITSGASPNLPGRRFAVTIADLRSSLAGAGVAGFAAPSARSPARPAGPPSASWAGACSGRSR